METNLELFYKSKSSWNQHYKNWGVTVPSEDRRQFKNEDLVLKVGYNVNRSIWDENRYAAFIDELCGDREYQKEAIFTALRFLLGGQYRNIEDLCRENFDTNSKLQERYGGWAGMQRTLQFPDRLSASLDLATGTGKSYVLYGIAAIMLSEGVIDKVLVLCPSTTIETELFRKFDELAKNSNMRALLPANSKISSPSIINARQSITTGSICIENYHQILDHVKSSIKDSILGKGDKVLILNDETHHVANESSSKETKWKQFISNDEFGFKYILGVSGTCYIGDSYFSDVIFRYSIRQAMEQHFIKKVDYVSEMPTSNDPDEKWQVIHNRHLELKLFLQRKNLLPLSIVVTSTISSCKDVAEDLKAFLLTHENISYELAEEKVLTVYNNAPDVAKLRYVDSPDSKVEWIVAVSMLNEGWDVKRVFQIIPHEERAFNSKLLIAQVLGRGLRIPENWTGTQPDVTVFNHDAWAPRIKKLVNEILEIENRISCRIIEDSPYHFNLEQINYSLLTNSVSTPKIGEYKLFSKGYIDLPSANAVEEMSVQFEKAISGDQYKWQTSVRHSTYTPLEVAIAMYERLEEAEDPEDPNVQMRTVYTDEWTIEKLEKLVRDSLARRGMQVATEDLKQKCLQSLGPLRRKSSESVRYVPIPQRYIQVTTKSRQGDSVSAGELKSNKTIFVNFMTRNTINDEQLEFYDEALEAGSGYKCVYVQNMFDFKVPLNLVIADSEPERKFIRALLEPETLPHYESWLKSTARGFYEIDYAWKKGEHPKRGKFSPDFFIYTKSHILVVEIKDDDEIVEPSEENRKKNEFALAHFERINDHLRNANHDIRYQFNFLTPKNLGTYFHNLRQGTIGTFRSELDVVLSQTN